MNTSHERTDTRWVSAAACAALTAALVLTAAGPAAAQNGWVLSHQKISDTKGKFQGVLDDSDFFGSTATSMGDLDGDGVADLAVGASLDDDGGFNRGAVWILFLNRNGTVKAHQKISETEGRFNGILSNGDEFGIGLASIGDLDGDGVVDLAVGARFDDDGGSNRGAVWILFLNRNGTVKAHQKISDAQGGFQGILDDEDVFGGGVHPLGDLDGDRVIDIGVGAWQDDDGGWNRGAVWILFLNQDGTVKAHQKISDTQGGFHGDLDDVDEFGIRLTNLGDLDGDDVVDLAVAARNDDDGGENRGAVWILFLNTDGTVKAHQKISSEEGGFTGEIDDGDKFGWSVESLGDLDGDGVVDLVTGAVFDDDGGTDRGAVWILFLKEDGTVKAHQKISETQGGFRGDLDFFDEFGIGVASLGDLNGDGVTELAVTAQLDDDGGKDRGAVWILFLDGGDACQYTLKKDSKPKGACQACPVKGDVVASKQNCVKKKDCEKKLKGKIPCPDGGRGSCKKIKGKRTRCG